MIHQHLSPDGVHPPNQFVPEIVSCLPCSSGLVRHILLFVYFFKELISFISFLDKCHTSVFNALISNGARRSINVIYPNLDLDQFTNATRYFDKNDNQTYQQYQISKTIKKKKAEKTQHRSCCCNGKPFLTISMPTIVTLFLLYYSVHQTSNFNTLSQN